MKTEKADADLKSMVALSTYGRDEEYLNNKLWLDGISSLILYGVGDGMLVWCALVKRIPIMCIYDRDIHKKTVEAFLLEKITKKMEKVQKRIMLVRKKKKVMDLLMELMENNKTMIF